MKPFECVLLKLPLDPNSDLDSRYWMGSVESVPAKDQGSLHMYNQTNHYFQYTKTPDWFWGRLAETKLLAQDELGAEGWIELTEAEFLQTQQELQPYENLPS